ncbi:putative snare domain-containing protein [Eutypa lata UCREL1]|uniref:t-SNARE affecting a late Golgi compartment protein 1 n=1 Tax=Eutypa lata (strain UCR-EL1) TaxID=1287681 RepID=M7TAJ4_EUTLA|nr:putative snare domain-containing protein [Eutypa lata UCREL1]
MMSSTNDEDPFLQVQQDVLTQLQTARPLFASYLRIRSLSASHSTTSPELASARSDLESALQSLAEDLADLIETVKAVESDPTHYGLSAAEVARRRRLVQEVGGEVEDMREELAKQQAQTQGQGHGKGKKKKKKNRPATLSASNAARAAASSDLPPPSAFAMEDGSRSGRAYNSSDDDDDDESGDEDSDTYAEFEQQQQQMMMREQDQQLEGVFTTVGNLRRQADDMGRELGEQHEMLEETDRLADRVGGRLQTGMAKLGHIVRENEDRWSGCCVALLIAVLVVLLVLLLVL